MARMAMPRRWRGGVMANAILPGPTRSENAMNFLAALGRERELSAARKEPVFLE